MTSHPMSLSAPVGPGVSAELFRSIAGSLPTGVTVVTTLDGEGRPVGLTSGAVCGLSSTPPLLLACVDRRSRTLPEILRHGRFCVNVLAAGASSLSERFAGQGDDKFAGIEWTPGPGGVPILIEGTVSYAVCEVFQTVDGGDHLIVMGLILAGADRPRAAPLVYHRRRYAGFLAHPGSGDGGLVPEPGEIGDDQAS